MPIITGSATTSYDKFRINSLTISNLNSYSELDYTVRPEIYGLSFDSKLVSGLFNQSTLNIQLSIVDPYTKNLITNNTIISDSFSGIRIDLYTTGRQFISNFIDEYQNPSISIASSDLGKLIFDYTGASEVNNTRQFFLDFTTFDIAGNTDVYRLLLNYPQVSITGFQIYNTNPITISPLVDDFSKLKSVDVYAVVNKNIIPTSDLFLSTTGKYYSTNLNYEQNRYQQTFPISVPTFFDQALDIALPFNIVAIPNDYFYTGAYFLTSGIKSSYYNTLQVPDSINNITGYISCGQNAYDKNLDLQAVVKWDAVKTNNSLSFEAYVYEDGTDNANYVFTTNNPRVEAITDICYGTGNNAIKNQNSSNYYSGNNPIFTKYGTSGIKWVDHTLYIDNYHSLPLGFYSKTKDLKYVTEVRIPSGVSSYPELYFVYTYEASSNTFKLLPSGGQYSNSIYTGTYSGARYTGSAGGSGPSGPSGPTSGPSVMNYETGILLAKRITGNANFVLSEFEPKIKFPVNPDKNYEIKVRASYQDGSYSDFSDILRFTSGSLQSIVTGIISNNYVIDGSGSSGYLAKYTDRDTISTGTLYYDTSNNLKFSSLPASTTSATNYLVVESNTIKLQAGGGGAGNGTTLIDTITQASHGFVIGDIVRYDGSVWKKANAESEVNAEAIGIVQDSTINTFDIIYDGKITGLSSLTPSSVYFLSDLVSGAYTLTEPTANNHVSKPVLFSLSTTDALFLTYRGYVITDGVEVNNFKFLTVKNPTSSENITFFYTPSAITISRIDDVVMGTSPSVTWNLNYAQYRDSVSPTGLFSSNRVTTDISGSYTTTFANPNIPPSSWLWFESSAANVGTTEFSLTIQI